MAALAACSRELTAPGSRSLWVLLACSWLLPGCCCVKLAALLAFWLPGPLLAGFPWLFLACEPSGLGCAPSDRARFANSPVLAVSLAALAACGRALTAPGNGCILPLLLPGCLAAWLSEPLPGCSLAAAA